MYIFESIKNKITEKTWDTVKYDKDYMKIRFESNNIFPVGKNVNIHLATIVIRAIFAQDGKYYPQLFLDDGLYKKCQSMKESIFQMELIFMSYKLKECMLCHYWYFLNKNFSYGPYLCNGCYNLVKKCNKLKNIAIVQVRESAQRIYFLYMSKREAKKLMINSNLIDKKGVL